MNEDKHIPKRIIVIGGGITGLAATNKLLELSTSLPDNVKLEILLLEASNKLGGVIQTINEQDCLVECGPDSFITQKPWAIELCQRLEIADNIIQTNQNHRCTFVAFNGKLHPLPDGFMMMAPTKWRPFINSSLFTPLGKLRMAMDLILPKGSKEVDESLADFVIRRFGREALERVAQPMIGGIYTADPRRLSLRATMPRFMDLEEKYGSVIKGMMHEKAIHTGNGTESGVRYSMFVTLDKGMQLLVDSLIKKIPANSIRCNTSVLRIESITQESNCKPSWNIISKAGETFPADAVLITTPSYAIADLMAKIDPLLSAELKRIEYASSVVINLIYNKTDIPVPINGFGFVVPASEPHSIIACSFSSVKFPQRAPKGKVLLRVFMGGALKPGINNLTDNELLQLARKDLAALLKISDKPLFSLITRWTHSMPQYHIGHLNLLKQIDAKLANLPGLALAGNAYHGVGIPDCIYSGEQAAEAALANFMLQHYALPA